MKRWAERCALQLYHTFLSFMFHHCHKKRKNYGYDYGFNDGHICLQTKYNLKYLYEEFLCKPLIMMRKIYFKSHGL